MSRFLSTLVGLAAIVFCVLLAVAMLDAISSPTYQDALTARYEARQAAERVRAEQWNETARTWGAWGAGALVIVAVTGVGGWAVVEWQRERSKRHVASETQTTQRVLIGSQRDVALAWIAANYPNAARLPEARRPYVGTWRNTLGVFVPDTNEFIPWQVARAELPARALLSVDAHPDSR